MACPIDAQSTLKVVMGDEYADDGDMVTIPEREGTINVAWNIYELAALQIPLRHVHPEGECKSLTLDSSLKEEKEEIHETDPRWEELRKIVNRK